MRQKETTTKFFAQLNECYLVYHKHKLEKLWAKYSAGDEIDKIGLCISLDLQLYRKISKNNRGNFVIESTENSYEILSFAEKGTYPISADFMENINSFTPQLLHQYSNLENYLAIEFEKIQIKNYAKLTECAYLEYRHTPMIIGIFSEGTHKKFSVNDHIEIKLTRIINVTKNTANNFVIETNNSFYEILTYDDKDYLDKKEKQIFLAEYLNEHFVTESN